MAGNMGRSALRSDRDELVRIAWSSTLSVEGLASLHIAAPRDVRAILPGEVISVGRNRTA